MTVAPRITGTGSPQREQARSRSRRRTGLHLISPVGRLGGLEQLAGHGNSVLRGDSVPWGGTVTQGEATLPSYRRRELATYEWLDYL